MHPDEAEVGLPLVTRLVAAQFPHWRQLPLTEVRSSGADNAVYRLGDGLAVRLPRRRSVAAEADRLWQWLPRLAPHLPLAVPMPVARGAPGEGFPFPWLVSAWLDGQDVTRDPGVDLTDAAVRLGRFVAALHRLAAVIDCGGLGTGDPAVDLLPAWAWLTGPARAVFRAQLEPDGATWARGRGWALGLALGAVRYYRDAQPAVAAVGLRVIAEVLAEAGVS